MLGEKSKGKKEEGKRSDQIKSDFSTKYIPYPQQIPLSPDQVHSETLSIMVIQINPAL